MCSILFLVWFYTCMYMHLMYCTGVMNDLFSFMRANGSANLIMDFVPHWYEQKKSRMRRLDNFRALDAHRAVGQFQINIQDRNLENFLGTRGFVLAGYYSRKHLQEALLTGRDETRDERDTHIHTHISRHTGSRQNSLGKLSEPLNILVCELVIT